MSPGEPTRWGPASGPEPTAPCGISSQPCVTSQSFPRTIASLMPQFLTRTLPQPPSEKSLLSSLRIWEAYLSKLEAVLSIAGIERNWTRKGRRKKGNKGLPSRSSMASPTYSDAMLLQAVTSYVCSLLMSHPIPLPPTHHHAFSFPLSSPLNEGKRGPGLTQNFTRKKALEGPRSNSSLRPPFFSGNLS